MSFLTGWQTMAEKELLNTLVIYPGRELQKRKTAAAGQGATG